MFTIYSTTSLYYSILISTYIELKYEQIIERYWSIIASWNIISIFSIWLWINTYNIFRGIHIHLPAILMFTRGTRFWPIPICSIARAQSRCWGSTFQGRLDLPGSPCGASRSSDLATALCGTRRSEGSGEEISIVFPCTMAHRNRCFTYYKWWFSMANC